MKILLKYKQLLKKIMYFINVLFSYEYLKNDSGDIIYISIYVL